MVKITQWVQRVDPEKSSPLTLAHLVESLVANDVITRCGKRLADKPSQPFVAYDERPTYDYCKPCSA